MVSLNQTRKSWILTAKPQTLSTNSVQVMRDLIKLSHGASIRLMSVKGLKETGLGLYLVGPAEDFLADCIRGRGTANRGVTEQRANGVPRRRAETSGRVVARRYIEGELPFGVFRVETAVPDGLALMDSGKDGRTRRDREACH